MDILVTGTIFNKIDTYGDFYHMIQSEKYKDSIFIFNDNEESYHTKSFQRGAGNACIRKFNKYNPQYSENPMAVGIPTGTINNGGYEILNESNSTIINNCINQIIKIIHKHNKRRLFYSAQNMSGILGSGIFKINENVLQYITHKIYTLTNHQVKIIKSIDNLSFIDNFKYNTKNDNKNNYEKKYNN
jgi:hypothetical protein